MKYRIMISLLVALCGVLLMSDSLSASTPHLITYQGRATNASGVPVADGSHSVWFFLYTSSSGATWVWNDYSTVQTKDGLFNYVLGSDPTAPLPDNIFLQYDSLFLGVQFDGEALAPLTPLASAPYAIRVHTIDEAAGGDIYGSLRLHDSAQYNPTFGILVPDDSHDGAGFFGVYRNGGLNTAFAVDGNYNGTGSPRITFSGSSNVWFDLSTTGNNCVQLPSNSIKSPEIANEAGVGSYINETGYTLTVTDETEYLGSRAMFAPSSGYVLVIASAEVYLSHSSGDWEVVQLGISDNCTSLYQSTKVALQLPSGLPIGQYSIPVTVHGLFSVDSGTTTFCFMAQLITTSPIEIENISITELFVPTAYTTVIQPSASAITLDPEAERAAELSFHEARLQAELEEMRKEVDALKEEMKNVTELTER